MVTMFPKAQTDGGAELLHKRNGYDPLDPTSTPQENAQRFFAKYNKQKRTFEALTQLIRETKDEISYLESIQTSLDIAMTEDDLAAIKEELSETGYVTPQNRTKENKT